VTFIPEFGWDFSRELHEDTLSNVGPVCVHALSELSRYKPAYKHTRRRASLNALLTRSQLIRLRLWMKVWTWFELSLGAV
jgi:hypothetical protein